MEKNFLCQNPFPAILRRKKQKQKKVPMTTKPRGGGKGLSGRTTKKIIFFCGFPKGPREKCKIRKSMYVKYSSKLKALFGPHLAGQGRILNPDPGSGA